MTYDIYAMFKEGAYLVASSNEHEHGMDTAEQVCKKIGTWPMGFAALIRGEHVLNCDIFTLKELLTRD